MSGQTFDRFCLIFDNGDCIEETQGEDVHKDLCHTPGSSRSFEWLRSCSTGFPGFEGTVKQAAAGDLFAWTLPRDK